VLQQGLTKLIEREPLAVPPQDVNIELASYPAPINGSIRFRDFEIRPGDRLLLRDRQPICIGSRAFDLLMVLLRSRGAIVSKETIFRYVWPATTVEESNLRFQVASLRKVLGADRELIKSIPGRGYLFASDHDVERAHEASQTYLGLDPNIGVFMRNVPTPLEQGSAIAAYRGVNETSHTGDEALEMLIRSAGKLVAAYGSIDAIIGALVERRR
jgi:DNA-binding winged helix-turn-helix (wHTH) protein